MCGGKRPQCAPPATKNNSRQVAMNTGLRPRLEEFFLALLWLIGTGAWGYFGCNGYVQNITAGPGFNLTGFVISFFLLCLTVFGLRFALNTFRRIWLNPPGWVEGFASLVLGIVLVLGFLFTASSLAFAVYHLFTDEMTNVVFTWGVAAC